MIRAWIARWWPWVAVVLVAMFLVGRGQLQSEQLSDTVNDVHSLTVENRHLVTSLQAAIVESCTINGNASRQVARETLHEEIHDTKHPDPALLQAFNLPPAKVQELLDEGVEKLQDRLARVKPVNCAAQYHISPGSGKSRRRDDADSSP